MKKLVTLYLIGNIFSACGIKGPPLPPLDENQKIENKVEPVLLPTPTPTAAAKKLKKSK